MRIYLTSEGAEEPQTIEIDGGKLTLGRGSDAAVRFADQGLSRINSTIYRDGDRVWIVDENSTNGTFVNDGRSAPTGTPLNDGDLIRLGTATQLRVNYERPEVGVGEEMSAAVNSVPAQTPVPAKQTWVPVAIIAAAIFVISVSAVVIAFAVFGSDDRPAIVAASYDPEFDAPTPRIGNPPKPADTPGTGTTTNQSPGGEILPGTSVPNIPAGKKYAEMSDAEKRQYVEARSMRVAQIIGNSSSEKIPDDAIGKIKAFVDAFVSRSRVVPLTGKCRFGDNLQTTFERASRNAQFIVRAFNEKGVDARIGLYLAMIESEHCVCLQSPTGPLGMFQFTKATAELHGLKVFAGASPSNPDERCQPEPSARAAASYMKALTARYGTGAASVPLAIGSYNSGEGGLSKNLERALSSGTGLPRDFWTLISKGDMLSKQFQAENFKYVPKFFAAAIIGENPQDFGLTLNPISTYTK